MHAANLPEAWIIAEIERMRRIESDTGERATIPLPLPLPPPPPPRQRRDVDDEPRTRSVIVIDLC
jgi:hypothetical protein